MEKSKPWKLKKMAENNIPNSVISVQELLKDPDSPIPQQYLVSDQEPCAFSFPIFLPTIDMSQLLSGDNDVALFELEKLHSTCKDLGIFQLVNHGVSKLVLEQLKEEVEKFYKLPLEEKMKFQVRPGEVEGFGSLARPQQRNLDWGDRFYMKTNPISRRKPHLFPELPSSFRNTLETYICEIQHLGMTLIGFLARALRIEGNKLEELLEDGFQGMRLNYYPPSPRPEAVIGLRAHSDATALTILRQVNAIDGLQIKQDGFWSPVKFFPDALVVNVGDILEILSNGTYKSIEHRATINSERERISVAFFMNPKLERDVGPLAGLITPQNVAQFKTFGMEQYVEGFFARPLNGKSYLEQLRTRKMA